MGTDLLLPRSTPARQGFPASAILDFLDALTRDDHDLHSLIIVRHGHVIAEGWWSPYAPDAPHMLFSLSKSFTSTAAGFAVSEGLLSLDDKVATFFPDRVPDNFSDNLAALRVRDLLTMTVGHAQDTLGALFQASDGDWVRSFLNQPVDYEPGTHFIYNSGSTYMVSAIVQKVTGQTMMDYLGPRLFDPLGISDRIWETCPRGINTGGWGFFARTETIAKFGRLYLDQGMFGGQRVLPSEWVAEATARQVPNGEDPNNDWNQGYGYQFWRSKHNAYRGDGAFGQMCVVMPAQDMVIATTAALTNMGAVLNLIWEYLLPAAASEPLAEDTVMQEALRSRLGSLQVAVPTGETFPADTTILGRVYRFDANECDLASVQFDAIRDVLTVSFESAGKQHVFRAGYGTWIANEATYTFDIQRPFTLLPSYRVGGAAAWIDNTLSLRLTYIETPFSLLGTFRFAGDEVEAEIGQNVTFGPARQFQLRGTAVP